MTRVINLNNLKILATTSFLNRISQKAMIIHTINSRLTKWTIYILKKGIKPSLKESVMRKEIFLYLTWNNLQQITQRKRWRNNQPLQLEETVSKIQLLDSALQDSQILFHQVGLLNLDCLMVEVRLREESKFKNNFLHQSWNGARSLISTLKICCIL